VYLSHVLFLTDTKTANSKLLLNGFNPIHFFSDVSNYEIRLIREVAIIIEQ